MLHLALLMFKMFNQPLIRIITLNLKPEQTPAVDLKTFFIVELTSTGICEGLSTITGEMTLARRMPRGLADERKEKCYSGSFWFLHYVKNQ